ncbi:hypothetical protein Tco_0169412 [Tanacetum coccineum]
MSGSDADAPPPPQSQTPVVAQAPHTMSTIKLPILKKGEYDVWAMKMEHYLAHTDYPLWEVIQKGNGPVNVSTDTHGIMKVLPPKTAEETLARERERKARTTLLLALPEDHLAKFHKMTDAKEMWEAIKSRFGGNEESKKNKANDNSKRLGKKEESNALMTLDGGCVDWTSHSEEEEDYALMACNSSGSDTELPSNVMRISEQLDEFNLGEMDLKWQVDMFSMRMKSSTKDMKKATIITMGKSDSRRRDAWKLWGNEDVVKIRCQMSANDKFRLGYGDHRYDGILSYENEVLQSVFMNKESDLENQPLYDRTGIPVNTARHTARASSTNNVSTARHKLNRKIVPSNGTRNVNTVKPTVNNVQRPDWKQAYRAEYQMCDKKNKVLFTDTECLVLSPEFKLPDENQVLLRIPRQNNLVQYSNLEGIVPSWRQTTFPSSAAPTPTSNEPRDPP